MLPQAHSGFFFPHFLQTCASLTYPLAILFMAYTGNLRKMGTIAGDPIRYQLTLGEDTIEMNDLIGHAISLQYQGTIHCKICGRKTNKSFGEGFCYPHFMNHPANSPCIVRPELCQGHLGKGRDAAWEQAHHVQPHVVYLALSSSVKVGVTRDTQVPTRWIDQGASQAIILAELPYRQLAGQMEVALKDHYTDKTSWQRMLKNEVDTEVDLAAEKARAGAFLPAELQQYLSEDDEISELIYPVETYPLKVSSLNLDKVPVISGTLEGIKGQYLFFDQNRVFNVRRHTGYLVTLAV
jgi:hypothetical protein